MTDLLTEPSAIQAPRVQPTAERAPGAGRGRVRALLGYRWLQLALVLGIGAALVYDRYQLCVQYLFRYTDEDQVIMWYAAYDLLHGRISEPCFYGQDYNTCLEGFLAAPLGALGVPYHIACPLATVLLGLFPYLLVAWIAWRRGHAVTAAAALLVPLLLPVRYGMMTGMPRGFHPGIAMAMIPAALLLPPRPLRRGGRRGSGGGGEPRLAESAPARWLRRSWPALRYFLAGASAVVALEVGENGAIILAAAAVFGLLTSWRDWKFWVFGLAGILAALPYPLLVNQFYHRDHPDYVIYLRGSVFHWGWTYFETYWKQFLVRPDGGMILPDLVPLGVPRASAPAFVAAAFAGLGALLLLRLRTAALAAGLAGVLITFVSFGYNRIYATTNGTANTASFPYARMYLAIPVLFVYVLLLANLAPRLVRSPLSRWATRGALAGLLVAALYGLGLKQKEMPGEIEKEVKASGGVVCPAIPIEQFYATAHEIKRIAEQEKAGLVVVGGGDRWKHLAYALYPVTGIDAIYGPWERRAWRMAEEYAARHEAILFVHHSAPPGAKSAGPARAHWVDRLGKVVTGLPALPRTVRFRGKDPAKLPKVTSGENLRLTHLAGAREYQAGRDYQVEARPDGLELSRLPGGAIAEGETVLCTWRGLLQVTVPEILVLRTGGKNVYEAGVPGLANVVKTKGPNAEAVLRVTGNGR